MATVFKVIEYLPIGANGAAGEAVLSEHATPEGATAAKAALYAQRPDLVGCLTIRPGEATLPVAVVAEVVTETGETEGSDARPVAGGAGDGDDGMEGAGGGGRHLPDVSPLRPAGRGVPRRAVEPAVPGAGVPQAGHERVA